MLTSLARHSSIRECRPLSLAPSPFTNRPFPSPDRRLDLGTLVVAGDLLPRHAARLCNALEVMIALRWCRRGFAAQHRCAARRHNHRCVGVTVGNVSVNNPATQALSLSSSSVLPITVSLATVTGTGFSLVGSSLPLVLSAGQSASIQVQFDPTTTGSSTGTLVIVSTSLTNPTTIVTLSGTGVTVAYEVNLAWDAPASSADPVAGYDVFRSSDGGSTYQVLNSAPISQTSYVDTTVQEGQTYIYEVESVDASGVTSAPSNLATVAVPN